MKFIGRNGQMGEQANRQVDRQMVDRQMVDRLMVDRLNSRQLFRLVGIFQH